MFEMESMHYIGLRFVLFWKSLGCKYTMPKELVLIEDGFKQKNFKTMLKYEGLSKKTQVNGFK